MGHLQEDRMKLILIRLESFAPEHCAKRFQLRFQSHDRLLLTLKEN